jgi:putative flippase GtrA
MPPTGQQAEAATPEAQGGARALIGQALRFGVVGTIGFVVDTATVYALHFLLRLDLYSAGAAAYVVAATATWALNRAWTFRGAAREKPARQWALFLAVQLIGFGLNRGTYAALVTFLPLAAAHPVIAVAAGSIAGMGVNFLTARLIVFR